MLHGYGTGEIRHTGPSPTRWSAQLAELETAARKRGGGSFASRSREERTDLVRAALGGAAESGLPQAGLLAHFYASSAAHDLCYQARIGKGSSRPLAESSKRPLPPRPR